MASVVERLFGTKSEREIRRLMPLVDEINSIARSLKDKSDDDLRVRTEEFKEMVRVTREEAERIARENELSREEAADSIFKAEQEVLDGIMPEAFAMVKETCRRLLGE
ncbi:MAG: preprotein translocase subunit SecA, partial [Fidelibacterota bacterium]